MSITQNGVLKRDDDGYPVMGGTSSVDNATIINSSYDPTTRRLLTDFASSSSSGYQQPLTGALGQSTFTWTTAPNAIVVDGNTLQATSVDGTVNWTGTTTTVMTIYPTHDIFAVA